MDLWHPDIVRAEPADQVRHWANLEGKSATTRDDLFRRHVRVALTSPVKTAFVGVLTELLAGALHVWWHSG